MTCFILLNIMRLYDLKSFCILITLLSQIFSTPLCLLCLPLLSCLIVPLAVLFRKEVWIVVFEIDNVFENIFSHTWISSSRHLWSRKVYLKLLSLSLRVTFLSYSLLWLLFFRNLLAHDTINNLFSWILGNSQYVIEIHFCGFLH